jgi:Flp pilus assembly protein TadD
LLGLYFDTFLFAALVIATSAYAQIGATDTGYPEPTQYGDTAELTGRQLAHSSSGGLDSDLKKDQELIEGDNYTAAAQNLRNYLTSHPDSPDAHYLLGYVLYRQDKPSESLAQYTLGARFRKPEASDLAVVAMDYVVLHDYDDADKWLTMATAWTPENALYWYYLGRTKYNENRFQEAVLAFEKCLQLHPKDVRAQYNLGLSYAGLGKDEDAESAYRTAILWQKASPREDAQPYLDLGMLLMEKNRTKESLPLLRKAVALDSQNPKAHEQLGRAYEQLQMLESAENELKAAVSLAPNVPPLHFELGRIYRKESKSTLAKDEFAKCAVLSAAHSTDAQETPNLANAKN